MHGIERPFFNADCLPAASPEYVAWADVMGTQVAMSRSIKTSANYIFKLHIAALKSPSTGITLYPVMDGMYVAAPRQADILNFLRSVFEIVAEEFNGATEPQYRFMIRAALAFGPVIHGSSIPRNASFDLDDHKGYSNAILLGLPMVQAHLGERHAPPFGVFIHESARSFAPVGDTPLPFVWWRWRDSGNNGTWATLSGKLEEHFKWCAERSLSLEYDKQRIGIHTDMAKQYFLE
jgi:hypothetical protein